MTELRKVLRMVTFWLTVIGGLNWGLVGLFDWDLVAFLFHTVPVLQRTVYLGVGSSALYLIFDTLF